MDRPLTGRQAMLAMLESSELGQLPKEVNHRTLEYVRLQAAMLQGCEQRCAQAQEQEVQMLLPAMSQLSQQQLLALQQQAKQRLAQLQAEQAMAGAAAEQLPGGQAGGGQGGAPGFGTVTSGTTWNQQGAWVEGQAAQGHMSMAGPSPAAGPEQGVWRAQGPAAGGWAPVGHPSQLRPAQSEPYHRSVHAGGV
jgi:hypothetical protein